MKKSLIMAAAAMTVFAACSKNEVAPVSDGSNAISYITVANKPGTKAPIVGSTFPTDAVFGSYAFHLDEGKTWPADKASAALYIDNATIKYFAAASTPYTLAGWHSDNAYYWPKVGTLTFFSYSFGKNNLLLDGTLTCTADNGLKITDYDVTGTNNLNNDFMVANIQPNKEKGATVGESHVPAEFKHALTQIVGISIVTNAPHHDPIQAGDKEITIKSIEMYGIFQKADFAYDMPGDAGYYGTWSNWSTSKTSRTDGVTEFKAADQTISTSAKMFEADQKLFIPQTLTDDAKLRIVYTIKSYTDSIHFAENIVEKTLALNKAKTSSTGADPNTFAANKAVTYNITIGFGGDALIYWQPTLSDWTQEDYTFTI